MISYKNLFLIFQVKSPVGFSTFYTHSGAPRLPGVLGPIPSATLDKDYLVLSFRFSHNKTCLHAYSIIYFFPQLSTYLKAFVLYFFENSLYSSIDIF